MDATPAVAARHSPEGEVGRRDIDAVVDVVLDDLTDAELIAQLSCMGRAYELPDVFGADLDVAAFLALVPDGTGQVGRVAFRRDPASARRVTGAIQTALRTRTRSGIGALLNEEGLHGLMAPGATVFPSALALAATWDEALVERVATAVARETRERGSNYVYAPVLDLARDPRWGRVEETFGEDPTLVARLGVAVVRGLQGRGTSDDPIAPDRVLACAKHFVGHGQPQGGANGAPVQLGERELREDHLRPFAAAVAAGVGAVMVAYHDLDGVPMHVNAPWLLGVLREELGFRGMVTSDGFGVPQLARLHRVAADAEDAMADALAAGLDCEVPRPVGAPGLLPRLADGRVRREDVRRAARNVLTQKARLGLLPSSAGAGAATDAPVPHVDREAHAALARESAERSAVLLTNDGTLPLDPDALTRVLVCGPNAAGPHLGGYCDPSATGVSVLAGLRERLGAAAVVSAEGCRITAEPAGPATWWADRVALADPAEDDERIAEAVAAAAGADVVVAVVGGNEGTHREGWWFDHLGDRPDLTPPGRQEELVERLAATGVPVVAVVLGGGPMDLSRIAGAARAVMWCGYPGEAGGHAVARLLVGDVAPTGRLPVTFPRTVGRVPQHAGQRPSAGRAPLHGDGEPLFRLGHGLTYGELAHHVVDPGPARLDLPAVTAGAAFEVVVEVHRTGPATHEVLRLHVDDPVASVTRPVGRLADLASVPIDPDGRATVLLRAGRDALDLLDRDLVRRVEPGRFVLTVAGTGWSERLEVEVLPGAGTSGQSAGRS